MKTIYKLYDLKFVSCTKKEFDNLLTNEIRDDCAYIINDEGKITIHLNSAEEKLRNWLPLHRDSGKESFAQSQDDSYTGIKIKTKNPDAYKLDNTLTDNEMIGSLGDYSTSFGGNTQAKGKRAMSTGTGTLAKGNYSHSEGSDSVALGSASHVEGYRNTTGPNADSAHAEGGENVVTSNRGHAEGYHNTVSGTDAHAEGSNNDARGVSAHAEGASTKAWGAQSHSGGYDTVADGDYSFVHGISSSTIGEASSAFGQNNIAGCLGFKVSNFVKGTSTEGAKVTLNTDATHFANIEVGDLVSVKINYNATGLKVTAIDTTNKVVTLDYKLSTFPDFVASDDDYLWLVEKPEAGDTSIGIGAFAGGFKGNQANQDGSLALGRDNIADGRFSVALGTGNKAGYNTFTFGKNNNALHAESTSVFGTSNTIENCYGGLFAGKSNNVLTQSDTFVLGSNNSLAKNGVNNFILGSNNSLAENSSNTVLLGNHLKTLKGYCYYVGQWNKPVTDITDPERFSVGIGDSEGSRKNGFTIYQSGYGEIYSQGTTNKSIVQKQYVDNVANNKQDNLYLKAVDNGGIFLTIDPAESGKVLELSTGDGIIKTGFLSLKGSMRFTGATGKDPRMEYNNHLDALQLYNYKDGNTTEPIRLTGIATGSADNDAANKKYVDTNFQPKLESGTNIATINGKSLLDGGNITIEGGGGTTITVDAELSTTSENPVQNKVITTELNGKQPLITNTSDITLSGLHAKNLYASSHIFVEDIQIARAHETLIFRRLIGNTFEPVELTGISEGTNNYSAVNLNQLNTKQDKLTSTTDLAVRSISVSNVSTKLLQSGTDALQIVGSQIKLANNNNAAIKITNLADGTATSDAVNKGQLDTAIANKQDTFSTVTTTTNEITLTADKPINITTNKYSMAYDDIKEAIKITFA